MKTKYIDTLIKLLLTYYSTCYRYELIGQTVLQITAPLANPFFKNSAFLKFIVYLSRFQKFYFRLEVQIHNYSTDMPSNTIPLLAEQT